MAKTIVKHGPPSFLATCGTCVCKFTYELEDVEGGLVRCPQCGMSVRHWPLSKNR